jgi:hypothetical protein
VHAVDGISCAAKAVRVFILQTVSVRADAGRADTDEEPNERVAAIPVTGRCICVHRSRPGAKQLVGPME